LRSGVEGVLVGRGVLRNPWILAQAADLAAGRPAREVSMSARGQFLLDYIDLLMTENGYERWVVNKLRALGSWYTKGFVNGSHLRTAINQCDSIGHLREMIEGFFFGTDASFDALRTNASSADAGDRIAGALAAKR